MKQPSVCHLLDAFEDCTYIAINSIRCGVMDNLLWLKLSVVMLTVIK